jgi:hypothetical protein
MRSLPRLEAELDPTRTAAFATELHERGLSGSARIAPLECELAQLLSE